jgi:hypothetical protein
MGRSAMESSSEEELEDDFPGHEWITPQSSIRAAYQSQTEKVLSVSSPPKPLSLSLFRFLPVLPLSSPKTFHPARC